MDADTDTTPADERADSLVLDLYTRYAERLPRTLWAWEQQRWHEFVFAILATFGEPGVSADSARDLADTLAERGLLDPDELANCAPAAGSAVQQPPLLVTIRFLLERTGYSPSQAGAALQAVCRAAAALQVRYGAKLQWCLRERAQQMRDQLQESLGLEGVARADQALGLWMQNVMNMPLPVSTDQAGHACEQLGVSYAQFVAAADRLDINVALLDDALAAYWEEHQAERGDADAE